jgi:hypothetical protein
MGEDEDFGRGDGIKPFLNPAPNRREEGRGANDLNSLSEFRSHI